MIGCYLGVLGVLTLGIGSRLMNLRQTWESDEWFARLWTRRHTD